MFEIAYRTITAGAAWIYPDGFDPTEAQKRGKVSGWFYNYKGVPAYHGPFSNEDEAKQAIAVIERKTN